MNQPGLSMCQRAMPHKDPRCATIPSPVPPLSFTQFSCQGNAREMCVAGGFCLEKLTVLFLCGPQTTDDRTSRRWENFKCERVKSELQKCHSLSTTMIPNQGSLWGLLQVVKTQSRLTRSRRSGHGSHRLTFRGLTLFQLGLQSRNLPANAKDVVLV